MDVCKYGVVKTEEEGAFKKKSWKPFFRQLLVCSGMWTAHFTAGLWFGTPTVYVPQVRREANTTDAVSLEMASWLTSIVGYATLPWVLVLSVLTDRIGRKNTFTIVSLSMLLVFICFYFSNTPAQLLLCEALEGLPHAATCSVNIFTLVEYTSPKYRGFLVPMKAASLYWGIWAANAIGTYAHWKFIPMLGFLIAVYSLTVFLWPESPYWLAKRGRLAECREAFRWLKGCDRTSEEELEKLIDFHRKTYLGLDGEFAALNEKADRVTKTLTGKFGYMTDGSFYKPVLLSLGTSLMYLLSGKQVYAMYAIDILNQITKQESAAYNAMLLLDGVSVFSMYLGCVLSKFLKRRILLFTFGCSSVLFLLLLSLYIYLCSLKLLVENNYISISLLIGFSVCIGMGPIIMAMSLYSELVLTNYKREAVIIISLLFAFLQSTLLKTSPYLFKGCGMHGTFLFYGLAEAVCLYALYRYLPETKDKTLQEVEEYFKDGMR